MNYRYQIKTSVDQLFSSQIRHCINVNPTHVFGQNLKHTDTPIFYDTTYLSLQALAAPGKMLRHAAYDVHVTGASRVERERRTERAYR